MYTDLRRNQNYMFFLGFIDANLASSSKSDIWDYLDNIIAAKGRPQDVGVEIEIDRYAKQTLLSRKSAPLEWWAMNKLNFPILTKFAQKYLCAVTSSVYSERLFSEAGNIYEKNRSRIVPVRCEKLLFIHHNLKYCTI